MSEPISTGHDDIDASIASLRDLAAWRTTHPEIPGEMAMATLFSVHDHMTDLSPADIVRAIIDGAPVGSIEKKLGGDHGELWFVKRDFGNGVKISFHTERDRVCTRRVVGTRSVQVPDPEAPLVTIDEDIVEWDCAPILAAS